MCDPGRWWVVGGGCGWVSSHTTRGRAYGSGSDCHVAHMTRVNLSLVEVVFKPTWHATWQKNDTCHHLIGPHGTHRHVSNLAKKYHFSALFEKNSKPTSYYNPY